MSTCQAEVFLDLVSSAFLLTQHQKTRRTAVCQVHFYTFTKYEQYNSPQANPTKRTSLVGLAEPIQQNSMRYTSIVMSMIFIPSKPLLFHRLVCTNPVYKTWCVESKNLNKALCFMFFFFTRRPFYFHVNSWKSYYKGVQLLKKKKKKRKEKMALHSYNLPKVLILPGHQYCSILSMAL